MKRITTKEKRSMNTEKWRNISLFIFLFSFFISFASCSSDSDDFLPDPTPEAGDKIKFEIGFAPQNDGKAQTRVATDINFTSTWENGDAIGIFAVKRATNETKALAATDNYIHNVKLTYDGTDWTAASDLWHTGSDEVLDFYAYYPYIDNANIDPTAITFAVLTDQRGVSYNQSDLLMADKVLGMAKGDAVSLQFSHMLSLVQVEAKEDRVNNIGPAGTMQVMLRQCQTACSVNLSSANISTSAEAGEVKDIQMQAFQTAPNTYVYRALVPAQNIEKGKNLLNISQFNADNKIYYAHPTELKLQSSDAKLIKVSGIPFVQLADIKAGTFQMGTTENIGNEKPHKVTLTQGFRISKYQVTSAQYAVFLNAVGVGEDRKASVQGFEKHVLFGLDTSWNVKWENNQWVAIRNDNVPMINVSWYGAKAFADWLGGSLPTEAQWEYACRAGTSTVYSFGDDAGKLGDYAWYSGNASSPVGVGTKLPNPWGLYDMHGNVFEWCSDWHNADYGISDINSTDTYNDPIGATTGSNRVLRGGSWLNSAQYCRSADRNLSDPAYRYSNVGFRVALP